MRQKLILTPLLLAVVSTVWTEQVFAQADTTIPEVNMSNKREIKLEDKFKEAYEKQKPVIVIFGEPENPDLQNLATRVNESNQDEGNQSILLVIDPSLEKKDSILKPYIDEHIGDKKGVHTTVLPVFKGKNGKPQIGKPAFSKNGYQYQIPDQIQKSIPNAKRTMAIQAGLNSTGSNGNSQTSSATQRQNAPQKASQLNHVKTQALTVQQAREAFFKSAKANGLDQTRLNSRAQEFESSAKHHKVGDGQVIQTYGTLKELVESQTNGPYFSKKQRLHLSELVLHNVARPRAISQGNHPTCNVTTLEVYIACRYPEIYADMVSQVVLAGTYKTLFNETISPPKEAYMPGEDENSFDMDVPYVSKRNHASQIVEMTLVNGVYETGRYRSSYDSSGSKIDTTGWRYIVGPPQKTWFQINGNQWAYTTDEDLMIDKHGNALKDRNGKPQRQPGLTGEDILEASDMVLGYEMPYLEAPYKITGQPWVYDLPTAKRLLDFKSKGDIPLGVHTMGGMHVQTIHDVVMVNNVCWILIDNQRGQKDDGWITLDTLHKTQKSMNYHFTPKQSRP